MVRSFTDIFRSVSECCIYNKHAQHDTIVGDTVLCGGVCSFPCRDTLLRISPDSDVWCVIDTVYYLCQYIIKMI